MGMVYPKIKGKEEAGMKKGTLWAQRSIRSAPFVSSCPLHFQTTCT